MQTKLLLNFFLLTSILFMACTNNNKSQSNLLKPGEQKNTSWWKEAVIYQIYPRSFNDSDGDGVGDLKGIIQKLDYVKGLGVDAIWLNPIYASPNADNGYDISNYQAIMKEMGNMADFDNLLKGLHNRGIKLIMDLVVNHCSDEHEWFKQSRSSRTNPYRNYFHWWPAEKGKPPFRPGSFEVDGSAWRYDSLTNAYYLHYFSYKQPDLNWENPAVRNEIYTMMKWWFNKGIDGFRMDVIPFISKDTTFPVITQENIDKNFNGSWSQYFASGPNLHKYLQEMNTEVLSKYNVMALSEGAGTTQKTALQFVDPDNKELDLNYHFDGVDLGYVKGKYKTMNPNWSLQEFKKVYSEWDAVFAQKGWGTIYLGNHDQPRMVTRWGNDAPEHRENSSKMLTTFLLSMRGTPFYYYGDELGMTNIKFDKIEDYRDIEILAEYGKVKLANGNLQEFIENQKVGGARDNGRTPMQWTSGNQAGFTQGTPWLKVNDNKQTINVEAASQNSNSTLNYFKQMAALRKAEKEVLVYGQYQLVDEQNTNVYAYTRTSSAGKQFLVLLSFRAAGGTINLNAIKTGKVIINNMTDVQISNNTVTLKPYQAVILEVVK
jgi:oligo-1,6-glucosidase